MALACTRTLSLKLVQLVFKFLGKVDSKPHFVFIVVVQYVRSWLDHGLLWLFNTLCPSNLLCSQLADGRLELLNVLIQ